MSSRSVRLFASLFVLGFLSSPASPLVPAVARADERKDALDEANAAIKRIEQGLARKDISTWALDDLEGKVKGRWKAALGEEESAKLLKRIAELRKVNAAVVAEEKLGDLKDEMNRFRDGLAEWKAGLKSDNGSERNSAVSGFESAAKRVEELLKVLPSDHPQVAPVAAEFAAAAKEIRTEIARQSAGEVIERMRRSWEGSVGQADGWREEKSGATLKDLLAGRGEYLGAPKTVAMADLSRRWLEDWEKSDAVAALAGNAEVKAIIDKVRGEGKAAADKLAGFAEAALAEAEAAKTDDGIRARLSSFGSELERLLAGHPRQKELSARADAIVKNFDKAAAAAEEARGKLYAELVEKAAAAWPGMAAKLGGVEGFDPAKADAFKGKTLRLKVDDLIGFNFKGGDFGLVTKINGRPVAGRFVKEIIEGVRSMHKACGGSLPTAGMDIVAVYEGETGRVIEYFDSYATVDGVKVKTRREVPAEAPVLKIIGLYAGPVAIAQGVGSSVDGVKPPAVPGAGGPGAPAAPGGATGGSSSAAPAGTDAGGTDGAAAAAAGPAPVDSGLWRVWWLLSVAVGLAASAAALVRADFAPVAALAGGGALGAVRDEKGQDAVAYAGLACAAVGLVLLARGFFLYGALPSLAIVAAGLYAALDLLVARGAVPAAVAERVRPLGVPVGLGCAAAVVLHLVVAGRLTVI
jgi:hypothetical protein